MTRLLIFTTGQTDVQLVQENNRYELDGKNCGSLHDQIEQRTWRVVDAPASKAYERISALPDGDLTLCTPKLDAVLHFFGDTLPSAALILETRRTTKGDPRFAGTVVKKRLHDRDVHVTLHAFLKDNEKLEDPNNPADAVVRGSIVDSLAGAIGKAIKEGKPTEIFAATTGGMAPANDLIEELTRLYAVSIGAKVTVLEVPDATTAKQNQVERAIEERFHPAALYRARWQALSLIQKGNLLGAWGAVEHLQGIPGQEWIKVVEWLARFASSLYIPPEECDIPSLKHKSMAVRAALRVEFALRAKDIPRAVHGTVAFFESALRDWLHQRDFANADQAMGNLEEGFTFAEPPTGEKKSRFQPPPHNGNQVWKIKDFDSRGAKAWARVLKKPRLQALESALSGNIRYLRNDVAHNEPTPQRMESARAEMQGSELWSKDDPSKFLSQPLVQNVLEELGIDKPDSLCDKLLETVRTRLLP